MLAAGDSVEEIFRNLGIDHLVSTIKDTLRLRNLILLKYVTRKEYDEVVNKVDVPAEKRALLKAFEFVSGESQELNVGNVESEIRGTIKEAGLDDKVWAPKILEGFKIQNLEQLKSANKSQIDQFLKPIASPVQSVLRRVFAGLTGIDMSCAEKESNAFAKHAHQPRTLTAAQAVRSLQDGTLCQGIYLSENVHKLIQERDMVIDVNDALEFKAPRSMPGILHNEFESKETMQTFVDNLDKHLSERSASIGVNIWGASLENRQPQGEQASASTQKSFVSSVHYQRIPIATVDMTPNDIHLQPDVIAALQHIEKSLKKTGYKARDHFKDFFQMYGTHVNHGRIEFGGILISTAYCEDFPEDDRSKLKAVVTEASETALLLDVTMRGVQPGVPFNAHEVLSKTSRMCSEDLQNIIVIVNRVGAPQAKVEKDGWRIKLAEDHHLWKVVNRASPPKPIWKILLRHRDDFENYLALSNVMQEEWKMNVCGHCLDQNEERTGELDRNKDVPRLADEARSQEEKKKEEPFVKIREEIRQTDALRQDVRLWIERFKNLHHQNFEAAMKSLASLRKKYDKINAEWQDEIIYLKDVQKRILWTASYITKTGDRSQKQQLCAALKHILRPIEKIQKEHFPGMRELIKSMKEADGTTDTPPIITDNVGELPNLLQQTVELIGLQDDSRSMSIENLQDRLESTIQFMYGSPVKHYEVLVCIGVLGLFGYSIDRHLFEKQLVKQDIDSIVQQLEFHLQTLDALSHNIKQAYILSIGLSSLTEKQNVLQYMIDCMPGGLCDELKDTCLKWLASKDADDLERLQLIVNKVMIDNQLTFDLKPLVYSIKCQINILQHNERMARKETKIQEKAINNTMDKLLEALHLKRYYPQKLTYEDMIMMGADVHDDANKKPETLPELPWYFMRHIIGLDSNTRENCHVQHFLDDNSDDDDDDNSNESEESAPLAVHPLDLTHAIFECADDFLRQELANKMATCQYAVPFILPMVQRERNQQQNMILHWGLKSMTRNFYSNGNVVHKTLVDLDAPLVACLSVGEETSWKSKLLNKMLSPQQETFWHEGLKGGNCEQLISQGMAEVAWYLPGRHGDNTFPHPMTFVNVRQSAAYSKALCDRLYSSSTVTCVFTEELTSDLKTFLKEKTSLDKVILVLLHERKDEKRMKEETRQLLAELNLNKNQLIRKVAHDANFDTVYEQLKKLIEYMVTLDTHSVSLSTFVNHAKEMEGMEVDDDRCYFGQMAANCILREIDNFNKKKPGTAKSKILSCQSDLKSRKEIAALDKELCRQRKLSENTTVQKYGYEIEEKKWKLQLNQLLIPMSDSFKYFLQCLLTLNAKDKKYFLQSLKLGLNERSIQQLQPLYEEYEKCRIEDESEKRNNRLKDIDEQLTHGSLGMEHFFREMAVMYENTISFRNRMAYNELDCILDLLSDAMAAVLMEGTAIEIMDGDAVNVPVAWLNAVLNKIENSSESTLFKVAVLGAQSCGKSTLLNTVFGLNFPVSSGRCTRGAYLQLVKVDGELKEILKCDYVAVIDSEGLMSRTKVDGSDYDNELSTFIIGLSDLTLVIIKGEGSEMHDVLPLAIHVFLRMNIVGEHQACHFVHQNMGAVDVMTKVATEIDAFVRDLNAKTLAAAKDVDQSDKYTKFTDVLHYEPTTDNTYVPGLWDGTLPMGKTNSHYSKIMAKLKSDIANNVVHMQRKQRKKLCTFADFTKRLNELWNAIKYENFVLSFKNVLAVEAHKKLTKVYDEEQWTLKREVREMIQQKEHIIENEIKGGNSTQPVRQLIQSAQEELSQCLLTKITELEAKILHYFQCAGCKDCNATVTNRHLLANNEKEFQDDIRFLKRTLLREIESAMDKLEIKMKTDKRIHELSTDMDGILQSKVQEAIRTRKDEHLTDKAIEDIFETLWTEATGDALRNARHAERDENIEAAVQATLMSLLGTDGHLYLQMQTAIGLGRRRNKPRGTPAATSLSIFTVDRNRHMKMTTTWLRLFGNLNEQDVQRFQDMSDGIIADSQKYYTCRSAQGRQFNQTEVELLFIDVMGRIAGIRDDRFKPTNIFKVDLLHHIETLAVTGFTEIHERYLQNSSPMALLAEKKKSYHDLFIIKMGQGDAAAKFCETVLKDMILKNIDEQLSCTELLHDLRVHCGEMFRDIKSIQASIMVQLLKKNNFVQYQRYITNYKNYVQDEMYSESKRYFTNGDRLKELARIKLDDIINKVQQAVDNTVTSVFAVKNFMKTFFSKIESLKISHNEASAYMGLDVQEKKQFGAIIHQQLRGTVRESIMKTINSWNIVDKLDDKGLAEFLFTEVVGCEAKCPFCKVPCDNHSGGKTQGNHSATIHRPQGLGGVRFDRTGNLVEQDCCSSIASNERFRSLETDYFYQPYKEYNYWYPTWTIHGNANPDVEKYWKWVFAKYNAKFAQHYSALTADIPYQWLLYRKEDIAKDIQDNYHVKVDVSKLK